MPSLWFSGVFDRHPARRQPASAPSPGGPWLPPRCSSPTPPLLTKFASPGARLHTPFEIKHSEQKSKSAAYRKTIARPASFDFAQDASFTPSPLFPCSLFLIPLLFALGALRYQSSSPTSTTQPLSPATTTGETFVVEGLLVEPPEESDGSTALLLQVERIRPESAPDFSPVHGRLLGVSRRRRPGVMESCATATACAWLAGWRAVRRG
jgi:hypothetical protein